MDAVVINTESLPDIIRDKLRATKVSVLERDGNVVLMPVREGSGLLGLASNSKLTVDKFLAYKREDKELD